MKLRYALLVEQDEKVKVVEVRDPAGVWRALELNREAFLDRLKARMHEKLIAKTTLWKRSFTVAEVQAALESAVQTLLETEVHAKTSRKLNVEVE